MELTAYRPTTQLVQGNGSFNDRVEELMKEWKFYQQGMDYYLVAILGCQSSGKSTLLNMLFGTDFEVLDAKKGGKKQTTLGVWMGKSGNADKYLLVLDVEGCDSKERGEDHAIWERKTALFSLALSDVLIINLWTHDIGRFEGANYGLLKVVFELNLKLFQTSKRNKTLLCFVFRDYNEDEDGSVEHLESTITTDVKKLWDGMPKPDQFKSSLVTDFFDIKFCPLPHKMIKDKFQKGVLDLQKQFLTTDSNTYLSKKYKSDIPADGLPTFAARVWETIQKEKDLDLPSQKQMLAIFRCEEISKECYNKFEQDIQPWIGSDEFVSGGDTIRIERFSEQAQVYIQSALDEYNAHSCHYDAKVVNDKRADLTYKIEKALQVIFQKQVKIISTDCMDSFSLEMKGKLLDGKANPKFKILAEDIISHVLLTFDTLVAKTCIPLFNWNNIIKLERDDLSRRLNFQLQSELQKQIDLFSNQIQKTTQEKISHKLASVLSNPELNMWETVRSVYRSELDGSMATFTQILNDFGCAKEEIILKKSSQTSKTYESLLSLLKEKIANIDVILDRKFKDKFDLDDHKVPRQWQPGDDVKTAWVKAKERAEECIDTYSIVRLEDEDSHFHFFEKREGGLFRVEKFQEIPSSKVLMSPSECENHLEKFRNRADASYRNALTEIERLKAQKQTPMYFLILLFILGWNEFMWFLNIVIFSPFLLFFFLLAVISFVIMWKLNLLPLVRHAISYAFREVVTHYEALNEQAEQRKVVIAGKRKSHRVQTAPGEIKQKES